MLLISMKSISSRIYIWKWKKYNLDRWLNKKVCSMSLRSKSKISEKRWKIVIFFIEDRYKQWGIIFLQGSTVLLQAHSCMKPTTMCWKFTKDAKAATMSFNNWTKSFVMSMSSNHFSRWKQQLLYSWAAFSINFKFWNKFGISIKSMSLT